MDSYRDTLRRAAAALPQGGRRLKAGEASAIANAYGFTYSKVRNDVERLAKRRNSGRAI